MDVGYAGLKISTSSSSKTVELDMPLPNLSNEHLVHFNCPICQKWWSIGDAGEVGEPTGVLPERDHWWCPWCGTRLGKDDNPDRIEEMKELIKKLEDQLSHMPPYIELTALDKLRELELKNNK